MITFRLQPRQAPAALRRGLAEIVKHLPERFRAGKPAPSLTFKHDPKAKGPRVQREKDGLCIRYARPVQAFRALGRILGADDPQGAAFEETARFEMLGVMIDVSRNGVLTPDTVKRILRHMALMGLDTLMLYAEETYEVPGEPYFGYLRGRYTRAELKALDAYAADLGIEMFPCIQTLGHLGQILQWTAYAHLKDVDGVLLAGEEAVYELLDKMIAAAAAPFRSKRIHIGMDEAWGLGTGEYRKRNGERSPFEILNGHLARVRDICAKRDLRPMIWSDMYFMLGSKSGRYRDPDWSVSDEVVAGIPKDVQLVYWDYYSQNQAHYEQFIEYHRRLGSTPLVAGGVWTWTRLWTALPWTFTATDACLNACKAKGVREVFVTLWGDDGMECDILSSLPGLQHFAEHGYTERVDARTARANFRGACGGDFDAFVAASGLDSVPGIGDPAKNKSNLGKALLWDDPALSGMEPHTGALPLAEHYRGLHAKLARSAAQGRRCNSVDARLELPAQAAKVLSIKCGLRTRLSKALAKRDRKRLRGMLRAELAPLRREVNKLWKLHRAMWMSTYKPFGWEAIDHRYGGLAARLDTLASRVAAYCDGEVEHVPELAERLLPITTYTVDRLPMLSHSRVKTPSCIK